MNAVIYYSNTEQSKKIAAYFAEKLGFPLLDMTQIETFDCEHAVVVFPVYCQNIPTAVKLFFEKLNAQWLTLLATYGKMSYGNVLYEVGRRYAKNNIVAAGYIPTKHSYLDEKEFDRFEELQTIFDKIKRPSPVRIPRSFKNPLADLAPAWRSRAGVKLERSSACIACGKCEAVCPQGAMRNGRIGRKCIRCLKCVTNCPTGALRFCNRWPMRVYLSKKKVDKLVLYV